MKLPLIPPDPIFFPELTALSQRYDWEQSEQNVKAWFYNQTNFGCHSSCFSPGHQAQGRYRSQQTQGKWPVSYPCPHWWADSVTRHDSAHSLSVPFFTSYIEQNMSHTVKLEWIWNWAVQVLPPLINHLKGCHFSSALDYTFIQKINALISGLLEQKLPF